MNVLESPAWIDGQYCKVKDLNFNILDLGLIHCDASYDVACSSNRKIFLLDKHIDRFLASCEHFRLPINLHREQITDIIKNLCKLSNLDSLLVWMGVTRGIPCSGNPRDLKNTKSKLFFYVKPYYDFGREEKPITLCLSTIKRTPNSSINQTYKNWSWIDLTSAQWEAIDRGYDSAVLLSTDDYVTEGPGFAVWGIDKNKVVAIEHNCLPSVTIFALQTICEENNIPFEYKVLTANEFKNLDFMGIASTSGGIKPVKQFEDKTYQENSLYQKLISIYKEKTNAADWNTYY